MTTPIIDTDDTQKLSKREEAHIKELEHLADSLEDANLLYGSALDGMKPGLDVAAAAVEDFGLDARMATAENDIAQKAADILQKDVEGIVAFEQQLDADDTEEAVLLAEDETGPTEEAQ